MTEKEIQKKEETHYHGTEATTRWVHHHKKTAKWLVKGLVAVVAAFLYYLKGQEKKIEREADRDKNKS